MNATVLFAFNVAVILLVWRFMVKRTMLDHCRDRLFDIRDDARRYFLERGMLDSPTYQELRLLLNAHIKYTHQMNFTRLVVFAIQLRKVPESEQCMRASVDRLFTSSDSEANTFVAKAREGAAATVARHTMLSSPIVLGVLVAIGVFLTPAVVAVHLYQGVRFSCRIVRQSLTESIDRLVPVSNRIVEELSLKYGGRFVGADTAMFTAPA